MIPKLDGTQIIYLSLAVGTIGTLYGYTAWAMPHILRFILH